MDIEFITDQFRAHENSIAIIDNSLEYTYGDMLKKYILAKEILQKEKIAKGSVVAVIADFSPSSITMLLALFEIDAIVVPISYTIKSSDKYCAIAECEYVFIFEGEKYTCRKIDKEVTHPMLVDLKRNKKAGLIFFSSGTTGEPKAALHDVNFLLEKFKKAGKSLRTITFLLFDHIGGFNTMMHTLSSAGTMITLKTRNPEEVCKAIEKYSVELLPVSPSFLNLMLLNQTIGNYNLSSLKIISYGTEPMPQRTLEIIHSLLPNVKLKQTYGLSELGIIPTRSEKNDSLYMQIGSDDFQIKIIDNILYIKAKSAMKGYLNAPSPFDEDGWYNTKDKVERKGDYFKILGRVTDIIIVGGEKVYPVEVENALLGCSGIVDVRVFVQNNPIFGNVLEAEVKVSPENNNREFIKKIRNYCKDVLESYKIPVKFHLTCENLFSDRFKKKR